MSKLVEDFEKYLRNNQLKMTKKHLNHLFADLKLIFITQNNINNYLENNSIIICDPKIIVIDQCKLTEKYFVICNNKTIMMVLESEFHLLNLFFEQNKDSDLLFMTKNTLTCFENIIKETKFPHISVIDTFMSNEICNLSENFSGRFQITEIKFNNVWEKIRNSFSGYLIKKMHLQNNVDRIRYSKKFFYPEIEKINLKEDEYIILSSIGKQTSTIYLIYHIKMERIMVIKIFDDHDEKDILFSREKNNYLDVQHPYLLKYYGTAEFQKNNCLVIEYIDGPTLENIYKSLSEKEKIKLIFEILVIIQYLHQKHYIYRDLKPDNILIDKSGIIVLIDLDRMIKNQGFLEQSSINMHEYFSPEIQQGKPYSYQSDIYSIGKIIGNIFSKEFKENKLFLTDELNKYFKLWNIYKKCIEYDPKQRPNIEQLINDFYFSYFSEISSNIIENNTIKSIKDIHTNKYMEYWFYVAENHHYYSLKKLKDIYLQNKIFPNDTEKVIHYLTLYVNECKTKVKDITMLGKIYYLGINTKKDMNKAKYYFQLASNQNYLKAHRYLGYFYYLGNDVQHNINKAIYYFSKAAEQDDDESQFCLGVIYETCKYIKQDIEKAIFYYELSIKHSNSKSMVNLGSFYERGQFIPLNIEKAIEYYTHAAKLNNSTAQFRLGVIYKNGKNINQNIYKSIEYFTLASNQNHLESQLQLGYIYFNGIGVKQNIDKAINFFSLAAKQNSAEAQFNLGVIYDKNDYVIQDINRAIYYYTLSAEQNYSKAQFNLGKIYEAGEKIPQNINKAIYYYTLSASSNDARAQYQLSKIYDDGYYVPRDIKKANFYLELGAQNNDLNSLNILGIKYYYGNDIPRNINKSLYYLTKAANQNFVLAQQNLGYIYYYGTYVPRDIKRAIYYYNLAANLNDEISQYNLGIIYFNIEKETKKAFFYFSQSASKQYPRALYALGFLYYNKKDYINAHNYLSLAAKLNCPDAQFLLGKMYENGIGCERDINKAIKFYIYAANQNHHDAQFYAGKVLLNDTFNMQDINKAIQYLSLAADQYHVLSLLYMGIIYHEGVYVKRDLKKAIQYYSEASSYNCQFAKNNLAIIYKNGNINNNIQYSIILFNEAIKKNDVVSMYNLAHLYFYGENVEVNIDKSEKLLTESANFFHSKNLLALLFVKKFDFIFTVKSIEEELKMHKIESKELANEIYNRIITKQLNDPLKYSEFYDYYKKIDCLYQYDKIISSDRFMNSTKKAIPERRNLTQDFYEGFNNM